MAGRPRTSPERAVRPEAIDTRSARNRSASMPVSPPLSSLLVWLTVAVLLLSGAPARQTTAGGDGSRRHEAVGHQLADAVATVDLAQAPEASPRSLFKLRNWIGTPAAAGLPAPARQWQRRDVRRRTCAAAPTRLGLFGFAELRL